MGGNSGGSPIISPLKVFSMISEPSCPLCRRPDIYGIDCAEKIYYRCRRCRLVFLDARFYLEPAAEKAVYDWHENRADDAGYRSFLSRSLQEIVQRRPPPAAGLDFGCGPGPVLMAMAREEGYEMAAYDKFYADDPGVFLRKYDFITCTEVVEHLRDPVGELDRLWTLLKPRGLLVVQTKRVLEDERFKGWFYRRDPTHIVFFAQVSFEWLAQRWGAKLTFPHGDVAVLVKAL